MKISTTNPQRTAPITVALTLACLATLARGETPATPIIRPAVDAAAQAEAIAKGKALLAKPKWKAELNCERVALHPAGDALICLGNIWVHPPDAPRATLSQGKTILLDSRTGRILWEPFNKYAIQLPAIWSDRDGGLLDFRPGDGMLQLLRRTPAAPDGAPLWEATYAPPAAAARGAGGLVRPLPIFADQQVIAGEQILVGTDSGITVGGTPKASLSIRSFDRKTGKVQWQTPVPVPAFLVTVEGVAQGRAYIRVMETQPNFPGRPTPSGFFMALNAADGKLLWKSESEPALPESTSHGAIFYTLSRAGDIVAYDGQTGKETWRTRLSRECDPAKPTSGPLGTTKLVADNEGVYAVFVDSPPDLKAADPAVVRPKAEGGIAVLDPASGKQTGYFNGEGLLGARDQWVSDLRVQGNLLLAVTSKNCLAIDRKTLQLQWSITTITLGTAVQGTTAAAISDGVLLVNASANDKAPQQIVAVDVPAK